MSRRKSIIHDKIHGKVPVNTRYVIRPCENVLEKIIASTFGAKHAENVNILYEKTESIETHNSENDPPQLNTMPCNYNDIRSVRPILQPFTHNYSNNPPLPRQRYRIVVEPSLRQVQDDIRPISPIHLDETSNHTQTQNDAHMDQINCSHTIQETKPKRRIRYRFIAYNVSEDVSTVKSTDNNHVNNEEPLQFSSEAILPEPAHISHLTPDNTCPTPLTTQPRILAASGSRKSHQPSRYTPQTPQHVPGTRYIFRPIHQTPAVSCKPSLLTVSSPKTPPTAKPMSRNPLISQHHQKSPQQRIPTSLPRSAHRKSITKRRGGDYWRKHNILTTSRRRRSSLRKSFSAWFNDNDDILVDSDVDLPLSSPSSKKSPRRHPGTRFRIKRNESPKSIYSQKNIQQSVSKNKLPYISPVKSNWVKQRQLERKMQRYRIQSRQGQPQEGQQSSSFSHHQHVPITPKICNESSHASSVQASCSNKLPIQPLSSFQLTQRRHWFAMSDRHKMMLQEYDISFNPTKCEYFKISDGSIVNTETIWDITQQINVNSSHVDTSNSNSHEQYSLELSLSSSSSLSSPPSSPRQQHVTKKRLTCEELCGFSLEQPDDVDYLYQQLGKHLCQETPEIVDLCVSKCITPLEVDLTCDNHTTVVYPEQIVSISDEHALELDFSLPQLKSTTEEQIHLEQPLQIDDISVHQFDTNAFKHADAESELFHLCSLSLSSSSSLQSDRSLAYADLHMDCSFHGSEFNSSLHNANDHQYSKDGSISHLSEDEDLPPSEFVSGLIAQQLMSHPGFDSPTTVLRRLTCRKSSYIRDDSIKLDCINDDQNPFNLSLHYAPSDDDTTDDSSNLNNECGHSMNDLSISSGPQCSSTPAMVIMAIAECDFSEHSSFSSSSQQFGYQCDNDDDSDGDNGNDIDHNSMNSYSNGDIDNYHDPDLDHHNHHQHHHHHSPPLRLEFDIHIENSPSLTAGNQTTDLVDVTIDSIPFIEDECNYSMKQKQANTIQRHRPYTIVPLDKYLVEFNQQQQSQQQHEQQEEQIHDEEERLLQSPSQSTTNNEYQQLSVSSAQDTTENLWENPSSPPRSPIRFQNKPMVSITPTGEMIENPYKRTFSSTNEIVPSITASHVNDLISCYNLTVRKLHSTRTHHGDATEKSNLYLNYPRFSLDDVENDDCQHQKNEADFVQSSKINFETTTPIDTPQQIDEAMTMFYSVLPGVDCTEMLNVTKDDRSSNTQGFCTPLGSFQDSAALSNLPILLVDSSTSYSCIQTPTKTKINSENSQNGSHSDEIINHLLSIDSSRFPSLYSSHQHLSNHSHELFVSPRPQNLTTHREHLDNTIVTPTILNSPMKQHANFSLVTTPERACNVMKKIVLRPKTRVTTAIDAFFDDDDIDESEERYFYTSNIPDSRDISHVATTPQIIFSVKEQLFPGVLTRDVVVSNLLQIVQEATYNQNLW